MAPIPVGFAQATMVMTSPSLPFGAVNTLAFDVQGFAGSPSDAADAIYLAWTPVVQILSGSIRLVSVDVKYGPNATGPSASANGETISGGSPVVGPNTCYLVTKTTLLGGRQGKGRMFLPGVAENGITNAGAVEPAIIAALAGPLGEAFADLLAADLPPVLLHADGDPPTDIVNFHLESVAATQRLRMRR